MAAGSLPLPKQIKNQRALCPPLPSFFLQEVVRAKGCMACPAPGPARRCRLCRRRRLCRCRVLSLLHAFAGSFRSALGLCGLGVLSQARGPLAQGGSRWSCGLRGDRRLQRAKVTQHQRRCRPSWREEGAAQRAGRGRRPGSSCPARGLGQKPQGSRLRACSETAWLSRKPNFTGTERTEQTLDVRSLTGCPLVA